MGNNNSCYAFSITGSLQNKKRAVYVGEKRIPDSIQNSKFDSITETSASYTFLRSIHEQPCSIGIFSAAGN